MIDKEGEEIQIGDCVRTQGRYLQTDKAIKQGIVTRLYPREVDNVLVIGDDNGMPVLISCKSSALTILADFEIYNTDKEKLQKAKEIYEEMEKELKGV